MNLTGILTLAAIVESIIEVAKWVVTPDDRLLPSARIARGLAVALGVAVSVAYGLDIMSAAGLHANIPYFGEILTGVLIGRGAPALHDVAEYLNRLGQFE